MASRLLFDENLSPRLAEVVADLFPGSEHIGNTSTAEITRLLRDAAPFVQEFLVDPATALLTLRRG